MLKYFTFFSAILVCMIFTSFSLKKGEKDSIMIGSGGGFSGKVTMYTIDYKGNIFLENGVKDETKEFGKMPKKVLCKIRKEIKKSGFYDQTLREPGNMYYFVETVRKGKNHKVTWGGKQSEDAKKMQSLYAFILERINQSKK
jgi:hypothetical protein